MELFPHFWGAFKPPKGFHWVGYAIHGWSELTGSVTRGRWCGLVVWLVVSSRFVIVKKIQEFGLVGGVVRWCGLVVWLEGILLIII